MRKHFVFSFLILLLGVKVQAKFNVCSLTLNSNNEYETFKDILPKKDFQFIELLGYSNLSAVEDGLAGGSRVTSFAEEEFAKPFGSSIVRPMRMIEPACKAKVQCDVLIISGHFGGGFFGELGLRASFEDLNELSCDSKCDGVFRRPKEVFLFGCNTLASKERDHRSPQEYESILRADGYSRETAQAVSMLRYGPLGQSAASSMQMIFSEAPRIYGFGSTAPLGINAAGMVRNYLRSVGDYAQHLRSVDRSTENTKLKVAFAPRLLLQKSGFSGAAREMSCSIQDTRTSWSRRLRSIEMALGSTERLAYIPTIQRAFDANSQRLSLDEQKTKNELMQRFATDRGLIRELRQTFKDIGFVFPSQTISLFDFADSIGLRDGSVLEARRAFFSELLLSKEGRARFCEVQNTNLELHLSDFIEGLWQSRYWPEVVKCFSPIKDPAFFEFLMRKYLQLTEANAHETRSKEHLGPWQQEQRNALFAAIHLSLRRERKLHPVFLQAVQAHSAELQSDLEIKRLLLETGVL